MHQITKKKPGEANGEQGSEIWNETVLVRYLERMKQSMIVSDYHDGGFLETHEDRYLLFLEKLKATLDTASSNDITVLEIGSYHLHQAVLMKAMGFSVCGVDLPLFAEKTAVIERANEFGIINRSYGLTTAGKPVSIPYEDASVDLVVCTEVLEHITFNPIRFWSEVYRVMKDGAVLYLTTPNSLSLFSLLSQLKRMLTLDSIGPKVESILQSITSGHHWKEYSFSEIERYFSALSTDFECVYHEFYGYRDFSTTNPLYRAIYWAQENVFPERFRSEIFVILRVSKKRGIEIVDPDRGIQS